MLLLATSLGEVNWQDTIFTLVGGLGIFLFGINMMGESLKEIAGSRLKAIIEKTTSTPLKGIFVGILITGLIQSSSGTTAITVGLVRAGLMTLPQAVGIILGANIGTTITSVLIGLPIKDYALPIMAVGSFLIFFSSKKRVKQFGRVFLGFGMLFYGLHVMGGEIKHLAQLQEFENALLQVAKTPILGVFVGALSTAIIQSSSATIGILQTLYTAGAIPLKGAIAVVFGDNIGTTITAVLAALGGSIAAKRTALAHVTFNIIGSVIFFIFLVPYTGFINYLQDVFLNGQPDEFTISFAHMGFNILNTFIMFWFIKQLVWFVTKMIPGEIEEIQFDPDSLQEDLIHEAPVLALESAHKVISKMGELASNMIDYSIEYSFTNDHTIFDKGMKIEDTLDTFDKKAHDYLVKIAGQDLDHAGSQTQAEYVDTIRDFERIGDHCTNLLQFFEMRYDAKQVFSEETRSELTKLYDVIQETMKYTLEAFANNDKEAAKKVIDREDVIDRLVIKNRKRHNMRINSQECNESEDGLYVDILSNVERIGDHCCNIAINILQDNYYNEELDYEYSK